MAAVPWQWELQHAQPTLTMATFCTGSCVAHPGAASWCNDECQCMDFQTSVTLIVSTAVATPTCRDATITM
eukprot:1217675-Lingulodinium_polyedra.AAC.1